jgi:hypothetical protein
MTENEFQKVLNMLGEHDPIMSKDSRRDTIFLLIARVLQDLQHSVEKLSKQEPSPPSEENK